MQFTKKDAKIGDIYAQAPACADDMTVLSKEASDLQFLVGVYRDSSNMEGYVLHDIKSVVLKMNTISQYLGDEEWVLGDKIMPVVENTTHMGILRSSSKHEVHAVEHTIQKVRRTAYDLMGAGLLGENGLDPESSISLLNTYVFPVLFCG